MKLWHDRWCVGTQHIWNSQRRILWTGPVGKLTKCLSVSLYLLNFTQLRYVKIPKKNTLILISWQKHFNYCSVHYCFSCTDSSLLNAQETWLSCPGVFFYKSETKTKKKNTNPLTSEEFLPVPHSLHVECSSGSKVGVWEGSPLHTRGKQALYSNKPRNAAWVGEVGVGVEVVVVVIGG